ncbi:Murein DD-endopeptidase MepM and murein hydrolase activator NlpD, contain LysM domain [Gemmobacter megaterium]|uniref:Murein DD-endopeptidase MepM and murein hydrolase activator NlpD, contain LysM domain n=1 Tax=Gemmobacter megaterium TaxID=1086013 RepID=A0A1N7QCT5_9RHOB|nr:peptidoglycan DD-metalloendopeptidase family protein [Gemmobacter megaterium]SIT20680.1 Murein DD-endopeptidase MepM and murein hydrolase activator NlpD, contain LysM domain [Gemmobacter megaterium]
MTNPLPDQPDLYAALRASGAPAEDLPALLAASSPEVQARLAQVDQALLRAVLRAGQGQEAIAGSSVICAALHKAEIAPILRPAPSHSDTIVLRADGTDPAMPAYSDPAFDAWFGATGARYGLGPYGEKRSVYASAQFADAASPERRTLHMGIDVFAPAMTPLYAPLPGVVRLVHYNADPLDYGHTLILEHEVGSLPVYTLYGHLAGTLPSLLQPGDTVVAGEPIAHLGHWHENGGWAPHVHFQIMTDMLAQTTNFFGVAHESLWDVWQSICPDPDLMLRLPAGLLDR